jgi:hypothetical protein
MKTLLAALVLLSSISANASCENRHTSEKLADGIVYEMKSNEVTANYLKSKRTVLEIKDKETGKSFNVSAKGKFLKVLLNDGEIVCK